MASYVSGLPDLSSLQHPEGFTEAELADDVSGH